MKDNVFVVLLLIIISPIILTIGFSIFNIEKLNEEKPIVLKITQSNYLGGSIRYCGIISNDTFVLTDNSGIQYYYSTELEYIHIYEVQFKVKKLDQHSLVLERN